MVRSMNDIIHAEEIRYSYHRQFEALADVSVKIKQGGKLAVIGANGCGKTTLLQILGGLRHPSSGRVFYRGREVTEASLKEREFLRVFRQGVGYIFQDADVQLFSPTVFDELLFGPVQLGIEEDEAIERVHGVMRMLEIENLKERPSYMLSGGEKKRVAIGSVLTMNPEVLLLDEPTNGLDPRTECFLVELMLALNAAGKTIVVATHDLSLVDELQADVAVLSEEHRMERIGAAGEILKDQELLLKVNLIHEHVHLHGAHAHKHIHSHFLFHRHDGGNEP
ncbi:MAG: nickel ABC transporter ATP-binding protein [Nitrospirae bacterium CG_4_9_14_3_um_filter_53_35]|nr:MAG: nickel ABC transporter ATP-binding protein [Nitrospirae bacterium CG08_land_8_20_14_0_20_52_24]PIV84805.1 MAG: nickel ABC transporter ATP-binding protein [Nitrospirae bacterium CG17_big_fil_post_rev_8_21_14_2_50_50_9]PIW84516.1 MAG: nickel ABC transporter ATP-binding protein [Nitrospirae bacterium CG_4_8_14_3_um_filter_50_41]PIX84589.1 MAG: nickel ABC transporter ATP-binding protein [Nitrospirae bacterium CG_4_10_14_3_um_filter_53_41]PJA77272.1 MAG: nickel ABC transporter ATP-binding pr